MGQSIGDSLPFAIGIALSPVPVIAVILMLLSRQAGANSVALGAGWIVGVAGIMAIVLAVSGSIGTASDGVPSHGSSIVKLVLGVLLILLSVRRWRRRPAQGGGAALPKRLRAIEHITPVKGGVLGLGLSALNPKNVLLIIAGGAAISQGATTPGGHFGAAVIFVVIATSTVTAPVVLYRLAGLRAERVLASVNTWLQTNSATMMAVLLFILGVLLIGKGIAGF